MKKLSLICLALIVCLGGLGIGYAAWTDDIAISGTVNTGTLDLEVVNQSNTWVWKDVVTGELIRLHQYEYDPLNDVPPTASSILVAYADADCPIGTPATPDDTVVVTFGNLFPNLDLAGDEVFGSYCADFLLHYNGSVPAMVSLGDITVSEPLLEPYMTVTFYEATWDPATPQIDPVIGDVIADNVVQMEFCQYILVVICIDIPEDPAYMGLAGTISGVINAIQWNEYVP